MNMESSPSTSNAQATPNVLSGNFPLLNNDDFIKKVTKELQKGHTAKKNSNTTQQPKNPSTDRECASKEDAIFNSPQVRSLCDRLLKEREIEIRSEYDRLLSSKLSEQYETFVKFAQDQITRKTQPAEDFSYYS
ncbi:akirin-2-like isoform X2 [Paramacrobiotus metropolitanus]|nr:akirin-2-like isoform X2 [Paramacrobiotus metropolitanus]